MSDWLAKIFIKDYNNVHDPKVRTQYGNLASIAGMLINCFLFLCKFIVGTLTMSIAIRADAINNLSDAGSSIISLISFRISSKPADREHPFGHARIEYIASMIVSFSILLIGLELMKSSIEKIFHPTETVFSIVSIIVLVLSILLKLWMYLFHRGIGRKINSTVMAATAADSLSDVLSTAAVLLSVIITKLTGFHTDAYMGIIVAALILLSGLKILNEAKNYLLGTPPDPEMTAAIEREVREYPEVLGLHDLVIHSYGPGKYFVTMHVEVDGKKDVFYTHDVIDNIERELAEKYDMHCAVHLDPIVTDDEKVNELKGMVSELVQKVEPTLTIHDFRMVPGVTHCNLIFDVAVPYECAVAKETLRKQIETNVKAIDSTYFAVITFDKV